APRAKPRVPRFLGLSAGTRIGALERALRFAGGAGAVEQILAGVDGGGAGALGSAGHLARVVRAAGVGALHQLLTALGSPAGGVFVWAAQLGAAAAGSRDRRTPLAA